LQPKAIVPSNKLPSAKEDKLKMLEAYEERINALEKYVSFLSPVVAFNYVIADV